MAKIQGSFVTCYLIHFCYIKCVTYLGHAKYCYSKQRRTDYTTKLKRNLVTLIWRERQYGTLLSPTSWLIII